MTTGYGNPFWDEPKRQAPKRDPFWEQPKFYAYLTGFIIVAMVAMAYGVFWQTVLLSACLPIAFGKYEIIELHTLEDVDDPFTH